MRRLRLAATAAVLALAGCGARTPGGDGEANRAAASQPNNQIAAELARVTVRPGMWEVRPEILSASQPNMPHEMADRMTGPRPVRRHCITPERAARPDGGFLDSAGRRCTHRGFAMRGGRLEGTTICGHPEGGETRATLTGRYTPEDFDFEAEVVTPGFGETMTVRARYVGRRVGECSGEGEAKR